MAYNDMHRQLLQYFMHERMVFEKDAKKVIQILFPEKNTDNIIELINSKISPLEFKINKVVCEQNGNVAYVFIATFIEDFNAKPDPSKIIFGGLVNHIFASGGSVTYDQLMTFSKNMSDAQLDNFFASKYLIADEDKNIFLSPLAISELEGYLIEKFQDKRCMGCMSIVGHGIKCQSCEKFAHGHCLTAYFKNVGSKKCPKCSKTLDVSWFSIKTVNNL
ncbi:non-structural maintenance of chromosomes element 1 homolog [Acyrthosiphon pisum]|uniref:Non-structural maintenance of chromosomes element 1 homolog n=1 Tax=Acyrthosiphon pisum TaxID=7029 RepID=A0A8R2A8S5_ACYPI|nr:non-structural maintenance of chromosomes element 1 homolog [Acyrthosiphon pisum]|eukprot:XP_003242711.1 PREDICTED: non-structural maintenance of chromosomes element 1 homolog [Acyrthosiphon pisum]